MATNSNYKILKISKKNKITIQTNNKIIFELFDIEVDENEPPKKDGHLTLNFDYNIIDGKNIDEKIIIQEIKSTVDHLMVKVITDLIKEDEDNRKSNNNS